MVPREHVGLNQASNFLQDRVIGPGQGIQIGKAVFFINLNGTVLVDYLSDATRLLPHNYLFESDLYSWNSIYRVTSEMIYFRPNEHEFRVAFPIGSLWDDLDPGDTYTFRLIKLPTYKIDPKKPRRPKTHKIVVPGNSKSNSRTVSFEPIMRPVYFLPHQNRI